MMIHGATIYDLGDIIEGFHEQKYMTKETVKQDFFDKKLYKIETEEGKLVACCTLEAAEDNNNEYYLKRFSIINNNFGNGYFKDTVETFISILIEGEVLSLIIRSVNRKVRNILLELGFKYQGLVKSSSSDEMLTKYSYKG